MLGAKFGTGVEIVKDYDRSLPHDPGLSPASSTRSGRT